MTHARIFLASLFALALLPAAHAQVEDPTSDDFFKATVDAILSEQTDDDPSFPRTVQTVRFRLENGETFVLEYDVQGKHAPKLSTGETVVAERLTKSDGSVEYFVKEKYRLTGILWLLAIFAVAVVALGGRTGLSSIAGLLVSIGILVFFVMPRIIAGGDPLLACFLGSVAIACTSLYLAHGFRRRTSVALASTLITLTASLALSVIFVTVAKLFGMGTEEAMFLQSGQLQGIDLKGLLLGGIIIGCLGVLDDITTAQTAAVDEIRKANPSLTKSKLRAAGLSVGKEHIASLINTLALAYIGTSLPLLLLLHSQSNQAFPVWVTLNGEFLAEEIVRTLVGSMTLLIAVPVSTWMASLLLTKDTPDDGRGHHHVHSH